MGSDSGDPQYVVEVKRSARRASRVAGEWVQHRGARRAFESKTVARQWARALSPPERTLWVQDAAPADDRDVDGYLVAARTGPRARDPGADGETPDDVRPG